MNIQRASKTCIHKCRFQSTHSGLSSNSRKFLPAFCTIKSIILKIYSLNSWISRDLQKMYTQVSDSKFCVLDSIPTQKQSAIHQNSTWISACFLHHEVNHAQNLFSELTNIQRPSENVYTSARLQITCSRLNPNSKKVSHPPEFHMDFCTIKLTMLKTYSLSSWINLTLHDFSFLQRVIIHAICTRQTLF
jgi:hypothetical protein